MKKPGFELSAEAPRSDAALLWSAVLAIFGTMSISGCLGTPPTRDPAPRPPERTDAQAKPVAAGAARSTQDRAHAADAIALPDGYVIEVVARGLASPTGVAFDDDGRVYVVESGYVPKKDDGAPRILRVEPGAAPVEIVRAAGDGPWTGIAYHDGALYVADSSRKNGRVLRVTLDGAIETLVDDLPSRGDHGVDGPAIGPDGAVYFAIGTATNSGVVGEDNREMGWLDRDPEFHDVPCEDVVLLGATFASRDLLHREANEGSEDDEVLTGAFLPFGTPSKEGQVIQGRVPCSGAVMRVVRGGAPELVAWGFRNPFGLAFSPAGKLFVLDNSYDVRGSRPVYGTGDLLFEVEPGAWYGWPDFHGQHPLDDSDRFAPPGRKDPGRVLLGVSPPAFAPRAVLGVHSSSNGFDFSTNPEFGHVGEAFVAQFGDMSPTTGGVRVPVGFKVVRLDVETGVVEDFAVNSGKENGPASKLGREGLERPIAARFDPTGRALYVVDFGVLVEEPRDVKPTGILWRIKKAATPPALAAGIAR
jgi:glucose/arabinose dehydrogenase